MNPYIGKLGSLRACSDNERLEKRPDFFKMINLKIIKGIRDYVNQTAASASKSSARSLCCAQAQARQGDTDLCSLWRDVTDSASGASTHGPSA